MRNIELLDCTLRDGGCVNDFNFGQDNMLKILEGIEDAGADIIECGYIDSAKGSYSERTQYANEQVITDVLVKNKKANTKYVAMIDYGKFDVNNLQQRSSNSIDGIRLAFHKKDRDKVLEWGKIVLEKGYELYIQPMLVLRYSDSELVDFITKVNNELPKAEAFYIVDSFGEMKTNDLERVAHLVDHNLNGSIKLGFHSHNNLQLSYSNAMALLAFPTTRDTIFDVSILGMGKGAGNLNAEIFAAHLNLYYDKIYRVTSLLSVIDNVINQIKEVYDWGYSVEYYLSALNHCTPSYAGFFYKKHTLKISQIAELLSSIPEEKKISFDKELAGNMYFEYTSRSYDDTKDINVLKEIVENKNILIVAPGKSVLDNIQFIKEISDREKCIILSINNKTINSDYLFITKDVSYDYLKNEDCKFIFSSNVNAKKSEVDLVVNYDKYNVYNSKKSENSLIMLLNILSNTYCKTIYLAGCDGFKSDMEENYCDSNLMRPVDKKIAEERNQLLSEFIMEYRKKNKIEFVTRSIYE